MRKLPSLTEMEHITSKEFGENMDAILDRISNEDIALIIDHNSKSYVLCPASWFDLRELKHLELINGRDAKAGDNEWDELRQALEAALPTAEKRNDENIP